MHPIEIAIFLVNLSCPINFPIHKCHNGTDQNLGGCRQRTLAWTPCTYINQPPPQGILKQMFVEAGCPCCHPVRRVPNTRTLTTTSVNVCYAFVEALNIVSGVAEHANESMKYLVNDLLYF